MFFKDFVKILHLHIFVSLSDVHVCRRAVCSKDASAAPSWRPSGPGQKVAGRCRVHSESTQTAGDTCTLQIESEISEQLHGGGTFSIWAVTAHCRSEEVFGAARLRFESRSFVLLVHVGVFSGTLVSKKILHPSFYGWIQVLQMF